MHIRDHKRLSPRRLQFAFDAVGDPPVNIQDIEAEGGTAVACYAEQPKSDLCCISTWYSRRVLQSTLQWWQLQEDRALAILKISKGHFSHER